MTMISKIMKFLKLELRAPTQPSNGSSASMNISPFSHQICDDNAIFADKLIIFFFMVFHHILTKHQQIFWRQFYDDTLASPRKESCRNYHRAEESNVQVKPKAKTSW